MHLTNQIKSTVENYCPKPQVVMGCEVMWEVLHSITEAINYAYQEFIAPK